MHNAARQWYVGLIIFLVSFTQVTLLSLATTLQRASVSLDEAKSDGRLRDTSYQCNVRATRVPTVIAR